MKVDKFEQMNMFSIMYDQYKITKPIRLIELFAGIGSQHEALKRLGADVEPYKVVEFDKYAILSYNAIHGTNFETSDITKIAASDLEIVDTDKYEYIMTYSFPCFTADSLVLTRDGYKKICDMDYGDFVLSHDNKYHKVVNVFNNGIHDIYKINAMGIDEMKTTYNHKFYVREKYRKGHKGIRCFREPKWKELKDLTKNDYLGIAINQECRAIVSNKLPTQNEHFWWIIGRYLGDGWIRQQDGIIICCDKKELKEITCHLDDLSWNYNIVEERTVYKIHITKKILSDYVSQFGCGAINKHLTQDILDLPTWYLKPFIQGYMSADGCFTGGVYKATSISRELIYGIAQCVAKVYQTPYRIYRVTPPKTKIIEGRLVNQNTWYQLVFKTEKKKQDKAFYENGYIWYPINSVEYIGKDNVYDIEVEDSHSFTVQNTIVHNCQDLSLAGKGKGMQKGSGTRSGLLWEVERILEECTELPQVLLMENVPQVHSEENMSDFIAWQNKLESLGYTNYWQDLNAKDYGIPQNRNRCFMVSILGKHYYEFPKPFKLELKLKDMLESEVDEKYYLSDKLIQCFMSKGTGKYPRNERFIQNITRSNQDVANSITTLAGNRATDNFIIEEGNIEQWHQRGTVYNVNGISPTICATDYKTPKLIIPENNEEILKRQLCNELIKNNMCAEGDVIKHSYTSQIMDGKKKCVEKTDGVMITLTTRGDTVGVCVNSEHNLRIRKLTPKECWRLMGFADESFDKAEKVNSNAQLYKQAGNSIVVTVLMNIFKQLL